MARERINWKVERNDVKEIMPAINIEIPIDNGQYSYIFYGRAKGERTARDYYREFEKLMVDTLYKRDDYDLYKRILHSKLSLSFIPDFKNNNYVIGYSPVRMYNDIFSTLGINEKLDYINYSSEDEIKLAKERIKLILTKERLEEEKNANRKDTLAFINDSIENIDKVFLMNGFDCETKMENEFKYKNLLYYLAVKSLDLLDETDDENYGVLPSVYYDEVTTPKKAEFPNQLFMGANDVYEYNYNRFNDRYAEVLLRYPSLFERALGVKEIGVMNALDIVKADNFITEVEEDYFGFVREYKKRIRKSKTEEELIKTLNEKITFYRDLMHTTDEDGNNIVVAPIKGKNSLQGYYGFVLNNNYIVLDKFFSIRKTDFKVKPSCDEAIYSMPLDLFLEFDGSKSKMMKYIKENPKGDVKRTYHTKKCSYQKKILSLAKKENASTIDSNWFLTIFAPIKLELAKKE